MIRRWHQGTIWIGLTRREMHMLEGDADLAADSPPGAKVPDRIVLLYRETDDELEDALDRKTGKVMP